MLICRIRVLQSNSKNINFIAKYIVNILLSFAALLSLKLLTCIGIICTDVFLMADKFGASMALVKSDIGGNISVGF